MRSTLVTGMSGTGKSVALAALRERDVLLGRIERRTTNRYGKAAAEREAILHHLEEVEPLIRATCTHEIDATPPLDRLVDQRLALGVGCDA